MGQVFKVQLICFNCHHDFVFSSSQPLAEDGEKYDSVLKDLDKLPGRKM
jgi:hypothetical protein